MCILIHLSNLLILSIFIHLIASHPVETKQNGGHYINQLMDDLRPNKSNGINMNYGRPNYFSRIDRNGDMSDSFELIERKIDRRNKKRELDKHVSNQPAAIFELILGILDTFRVNNKKIGKV